MDLLVGMGLANIIVLNVTSSGIVALLLEGGRTAHSLFAIPINVVKDSMCNIFADSELAELLRMTKLIIWAEAPMVNRQCYETFDRTMRDICRIDPSMTFEQVFGGKVVVFGGDFRQILPIVPNSSRQDVVHATINSSYLWNHCTIIKFTVNMRIGSRSNSSERKEIQDFADWILNIGNGKIGGNNDGEANVEFPNDMLILDSDDHIERAILAPTHKLVDMINDRMLSLIPGDEKTYNSSDTVGVADVDPNFKKTMYTEEFLNNLNMAGIPYHSLKLKIGTPVMWMGNIDQRVGLCNETRLQVLRMGTNVIEAKIIFDGSVGTISAIPRMVISPSDTKFLFKLNRREFPIRQGHTLSKAELFLQGLVFSHGQLYVVVSRIKTKKGLKVLCCDRD
nr:hypothetical protein [Tanacetum cinerariifolium]